MKPFKRALKSPQKSSHTPSFAHEIDTLYQDIISRPINNSALLVKTTQIGSGEDSKVVTHAQHAAGRKKDIHNLETWHVIGFYLAKEAALRDPSKMADNLDSAKQRADEIQNLRSEINALQARLKASAEKNKQLSWDTELLVKKTQGFKAGKIISTKDPNWKQVVASIEIGPEGICVSDVRNIDSIEFIAAFAADRQLTMTYGNGSFLLEPRNLPD
jgi:hypothetical protein